MNDKQAVQNTDRELWRERDSYYAPSIHVTKDGAIGLNVGGTVYVKSIRDWHALATRAESRQPVSGDVTEAEVNSFASTLAIPIRTRQAFKECLHEFLAIRQQHDADRIAKLWTQDEVDEILAKAQRIFDEARARDVEVRGQPTTDAEWARLKHHGSIGIRREIDELLDRRSRLSLEGKP